MRKLLDSALATYPDHPGLLAQRAALALVDDRPDEAVALLDRAVAADPFNRQCVYQRALALFRIGKHAEGRRKLANSSRLNELADQLSGLLAGAGRIARRPPEYAPSSPRCPSTWATDARPPSGIARPWGATRPTRQHAQPSTSGPADSRHRVGARPCRPE